MSLFIFFIGPIIPIIFYYLLGFIQRKIKIKLYWILTPFCLFLTFVVPFYIPYLPKINFIAPIDKMIGLSIRMGLFYPVVIPSFIISIVCTIIGYAKKELE